MEIFDPCAKQHGRTTAASEGCPHRSVLLAAMIDLHARPIKPGFWQLSAGGVSVNLDDEQMARYKASGRFWYDEAGGASFSTPATPAKTASSASSTRRTGSSGPTSPPALSDPSSSRPASPPGRPPRSDRRGLDPAIGKGAYRKGWENARFRYREGCLPRPIGKGALVDRPRTLVDNGGASQGAV